MKKIYSILILCSILLSCSSDDDSNSENNSDKYIQADNYGFHFENLGENPNLHYKIYDFATGEILREGDYSGTIETVSFQTDNLTNDNNYTINFTITDLNQNDDLKVYFFANKDDFYLNQIQNPNANTINQLNPIIGTDYEYEGNIMINSREEFWISNFDNN